MTESSVLLRLEDLKVALPLEEGVLKAVDGVTLEIKPGQTLGLVGESGCGKSTLALSILRLTPRFAETTGRILYQPRTGGAPLDLAQLDPYGDAIRAVRGNDIAMIFQEPMTSFSPLYTIGNQITEAIWLHRTNDAKAAREIAIDMLDRVGISNPRDNIAKYPQQLSGGMRQRAMIAMALSCQPRLLIADEPTTALDVTVQAQVLKLMRDLQAQFGMSILYITHDLGVIARMVDEVAIMYLGRIVEKTDVDSLFHEPRHPYTQALLRSVPKVGKRAKHRLELIQGNVPVPINKPRGCDFHPRCPFVMPGMCDTIDPPLVAIEAGHHVSCYLYPPVVAAVRKDEDQVEHAN